MATVTLYQPVDMSSLTVWYGNTPVANATHIRVTDGYRVQDYFGSFQYDAYGLSGGYVQSTVGYAGGARLFEVGGFNVNAVSLESYVSYDAQAAMGYILAGDYSLYGSAGPDVLLGYAGDDRLYGYDGNDRFVADAGSDWIDGGAGLDVVRYAGSANAYSVFAASGDFKVSDNAGTFDTLHHVERVAFGDGRVLALDIGFAEHAGAAYRLYQAAFDRTPDREGLAFWVAQLDSGSNLFQVADGFVSSPEFGTLYPDLSSDTVLHNYYLNVLDRPADAEGFAYWSAQMANGLSASEVLVWFAESPENMARVSPDIEAGIWLV